MLELTLFFLLLFIIALLLLALSPLFIVPLLFLIPRKFSVNFNFCSGKRRRILVVGGGAAGTAATWSLARFPDKFDVELWEAEKVCGGQATSESFSSHPAPFINDGVQGAAPSYHNTLQLHKLFGFEHTPVHMMISFGKNETNWNNYPDQFQTDLVQEMAKDIKRFGKVLKWVSRLEPIFVIIPIKAVLRMWRFNKRFGDLMVYPLVALFFGTGNQTPNVSAAIVARVFLDPDLRLFDYDPQSLLSQSPRMYAFGNLKNIYETITSSLNATVCKSRPVKSVVRHAKGVTVTDANGVTSEFDDIILACSAEQCLKILQNPTWMERKVLGNVKYYDDVTITHEDLEYMQRHYDIDLGRNDQYFIRTDPNDRSKIEMSFDLSNYQPQLQAVKSERRVFQTIFLDKRKSSAWTIGEISKPKILLEKWWRQFAHEWTHFAFTVPFIRFLQGRKHTYFCGSWTLINTHEIATISGLAAAARLGAPYPFCDDKLAVQQFDQYLAVIHGKRRPANAAEKAAQVHVTEGKRGSERVSLV